MDLLELYELSKTHQLSNKVKGQLRQIIEAYPFFSLPYIVSAKITGDPIDLFRASTFATNRKMLHAYMEGEIQKVLPDPKQIEPQKPKPEQIKKPDPGLKTVPKKTFQPPSKKETPKIEEKEDTKPKIDMKGKSLFSIIEFEQDEQAHSSEHEPLFIEREKTSEGVNPLLNLHVTTSIQKYRGTIEKINQAIRKGKKKIAKEKKQKVSEDDMEILDSFLKEPQNISQIDERKSVGPDKEALASVENNDALVSETLAKIHLMQGNKAEAKNIYRKLILLFPDKSAYFEAKIDKI